MRNRASKYDRVGRGSNRKLLAGRRETRIVKRKGEFQNLFDRKRVRPTLCAPVLPRPLRKRGDKRVVIPATKPSDT
jgi:hypothetical protein